jgi:hypothetical protein
VLGELYRLLPKPKVNTNQARIRRQDTGRLPNVFSNRPRLEPRGFFVAAVFVAEAFFEDA